MMRYLTVLILGPLALLTASSQIAASDTSLCLRVGAALDAGVLVPFGDLISAAAACERAREHATSITVLTKVAVAHEAIEAERRRRAFVR
jgi:hypothetical protein